MAKSDASVVRAVKAFGCGWESMVALANACLVCSKAVVMVSLHTRLLGFPLRAWKRDTINHAAEGMNLR